MATQLKLLLRSDCNTNIIYTFVSMKRNVIAWLKTSNRWKHLVGGLIIGIGSDNWYCALYAGIGVASALELKDKLWGGEWDWIDLTLTAAGSIIGHLIRFLLW